MGVILITLFQWLHLCYRGDASFCCQIKFYDVLSSVALVYDDLTLQIKSATV